MLYLLIVGAYLVFVIIVIFICNRLKIGLIGKIAVTVILLLAPFWDIFLTKGIMSYYASQNAPLQKIIRTVNKPESVLWLDEVWPGFDAYGRAWMVENYLDGINLNILALNDGEGNIYLFRATSDDFSESEKLYPAMEKARKQYDDLFAKTGRLTKEIVRYQLSYIDIRAEYDEERKKEAVSIINRAEVYPYSGKILPVDLPHFKYNLKFRRLRLPAWQERFVWCDEIAIQDKLQEEIIGLSKRCLAYSPATAMIMVGSSPFEGGERLGDERAYEFDDKVLFEYARVRDTLEITKDNLDRSFYRLIQ